MTLNVIDPAASSAGNALGLQDFMKILLTQLTYQDPLKPMDNKEFMAQMAQFTALEQSQRLNERVQVLVENQAALQSLELIGRTVEIATENGAVSGAVTALSLQGASPLLTLALAGGQVVSGVHLAQILSVR